MLDFRNVLGRMGELESNALVVPASPEAPALDYGHLVRHFGVHRSTVFVAVASG
jgi:hypothetical protein